MWGAARLCRGCGWFYGWHNVVAAEGSLELVESRDGAPVGSETAGRDGGEEAAAFPDAGRSLCKVVALALALVVVLAAGCGGSTGADAAGSIVSASSSSSSTVPVATTVAFSSPVVEGLPAELDEAYERWRRLGPNSYLLRVGLGCECGAYPTDIFSWVRGGSPTMSTAGTPIDSVPGFFEFVADRYVESPQGWEFDVDSFEPEEWHLTARQGETFYGSVGGITEIGSSIESDLTEAKSRWVAAARGAHLLSVIYTTGDPLPWGSVEDAFAWLDEQLAEGVQAEAVFDGLGSPTYIGATGSAGELELAHLQFYDRADGLDEDLRDAKRRWASNGPASYQLRVTLECFCRYTDPYTVSVVDGEVQGIELVSSVALAPAEQRKMAAEVPLTVEDLFARIGAAHASGVVRARFDHLTGAPTYIDADPFIDNVDDEYVITAVLE